MSSEPIKVKTTDSRTRSQVGTRRREARGVSLRRAVLDTMALEPRTLMATLPPSLFNGTSLVDRSGTGNMSTPSIAIDQNNPQKLVAAWTLNDPTFAPGPTEVVRVAFSNDGGATWQTNGAPGGFIGDPSTSNPTVIFQQALNASVGFDRNDNAYVFYEQSNVSVASAAPNNGALLLSKYNFTGANPTRTLTNSVVYEWNGNDGALFPTMTVDDTVANFSDVGADGVTRVQSNPYAGNVYFAWETNDTIPSLQIPGIANYNPNRIKIVASSDGGQTFSIQQTLNTSNNNFAGGKETTPRIAVSQGRAPGTNGPTDKGVAPGTTSVVWDDYYSGRNANPPIDLIHNNSVSNTYSQTFASAGGGIQDAGAGTPNSPATTDFPVTVNVSDPRFLSLSNLNVSVSIIHPAVAELNIQLVPPAGSGLSPITLVANQVDAAGTANTGRGVSGANMGVSPSGDAIGTVFDDEATRNIFDSTNTGTNANAAPYVGHYRAEGGSLNAFYAGATAGAANAPNSVNGTWTLRVTDFRNGNVGFVANWKLILTSGMTTAGDNTITSTVVRAQQPGNQTASAATPLGIAPDPVIASDNTLGAYSPHSGRLYLAYVDKSVAQSAFQNNPADNTDIFLATSDDGGLTWITSTTPVNDDRAIKDGYSEAGYFTNGKFTQVTGRPQFEPSITVDQATGTLVMSWYDTRDDSAKARVATYLTTSIDGGQTFSPDVYANDPQTATDAITGNNVNLTPVPDNYRVEGAIGFGYHQGLAAFGGHAYPIWSSNSNGGNFTGTPVKLGIVTNTATYAAGPRIISSTQGPIGGPNDNVNTTTAADGTPLASAFQVVFDRPIDPSTFSTSDVQVKYTDTTQGNLTGGFVPVNSVVPLDKGQFGATTFLVNFAPRSGVGTYSLAITSASIRDSIRTARLSLAQAGPASNLLSTDVPKSIPPITTVTSNLVVSGYPLNQVVDVLTVNLSITSAVASSLSISLIAPDGTTVSLARFEPFFGAGGQNYTNTTFDDRATTSINQGNAPFTGIFQPVTPLSTFKTHAINGVWQLQVRSVRGNPLTSTITNWSMNLTPGSVSTVTTLGNPLDQNSNGIAGEGSDFFAAPFPISTNVPYSPFVGPFQSGTLPLILPGPHIASTSLPGIAATADNLVLDKAVSAIDVTFDRDMDPTTVTAASVLRVVGPLGTINGPFTITANPLGSDPDPAHPRTYRIGFSTQKISGTYTVTLASTITDKHGNALDTNLNAGVDLLKKTVNGPTNPVQYPAAVGNGTITGGKTLVSTLTVSDNYLVQGLTLQLNITDNNDPNLQITLVSPNNIPIVLVPRGSGTSGTKSNFTDTVFDDAAASLIQNGAPPFFGRFKPLQPLSGFNGISTQGTWKLFVDDDPTNPNITPGRLNSWSLTFQKGVPSSGLGEPVSDQATASFRIFNTAVTNHLASSTWTAVGPASMVDVSSSVGATNGFAGRIDTIAVDPSDPSGNTVYVGASSGGIWKTVDFLTNSPQGPTYVPLTDFGPTSAINIGSIAVFARNNDPRQSIIVAGTGDPNTSGYPGAGSSVGALQRDNTYTGVGFLISKDGGATWTLSNSATFAPDGGTNIFKVVVDPRPTASGQVIMYAAVGDNAPVVGAKVPSRNGLWRSDDTGQTWTKYNSGVGGFDVPATDVILDYNSGTIDAVSNPTGNINTIYVAFPGNGVYSSPNRGNQLNHLTGGNALPLIWDNVAQRQVPVNNNLAPTGLPTSFSFIRLAKPALLPNSAPNADVENTLYQGWLYAYVNGGTNNGLYLTKDYGQTWTYVKISTLPNKNLVPNPAVPTNDPTQPNYDPNNSQQYAHNQTLSLAVDPTNPAIAYVGGTANGKDSGFIRVDTTRIFDSHAFISYDGTRPDGGALQIATTGRSQVDNAIFGPSEFIGTSGAFGAVGPYINLIQDPTTPFLTNATVFVNNVASETNDGSGTRWIPIDQMLQANASSLVPSTNVHTIVSMIDPVTGAARLIVGDDQGVFTGVLDANGTIIPGVGNATSATYSRNGNLQIAQLLYGASQPSNTLLNSQVASALYLANGYNLGQVGSDPNVLNNGNIVGVGSTNGSTLGVIAATSADQMGTGVAVDQQGKNIVFRYLWPEFGGDVTDFFQVSLDGGRTFVSRTFGLVQSANDPQWPSESANYGNGLTFGNFTVNPINSDQIIISSAAGRVFSTINQGKNWSVIAEPGQGALDGSYAPALTYGAPDPSAPGGIGNLNNFIYAGTVNGNIYVTRIGGGTWTLTNAAGGLDGSPVMKIVADPTRGSHAAYAVTQKGVYYTANSITGGAAAWQNVTGSVFSITNPGFNAGGFGGTPYLNYLTSIAADWRYAIPNATVNGISTGTHPMLYVSGEAGVFRSIDNGTTWTLFPNQAIDGAPADGGYLPNAQVTDLTLSLGKIDPTTGRPIAVPGDPDTLLATTFGRGQFSIRLAPVVFPASVALDPKLPLPTGSVGGKDTATGLPLVTIPQPYFDGLSEATSIGNRVRITLLDLTIPGNPRIIGGYDPSKPATDIAANWTDAAGKFAVQVSANGFSTNGVKTIGIQATDLAGVVGNPATFTFVLNAKLNQQGQPPAIPTIALNPLDDTSGGLNITKVTNPRIIGVTDAGVQVQLFNASNLTTPLATGISDALGNYSLQYPTSPAGTYSVVVIATNANGTAKSATLTFTIKTSVPTNPATLTLDPNDDTGIKGDNLTTVRFPHFIGVTDPGNKVSLYTYNTALNARGPILATTTADSTGHYSIQLPFSLADGSITLQAGITDVAGNAGPFSTALTVTIVTTNADYIGNGKTDPALFRRTNTSGALWIIQGVPPASGIAFGGSNLDVPFTGDFNGNGKADLALYRPSTNTWYIQLPSGTVSYVLGTPGSVPVVGNFDGNFVTETAAFVPSTGVWTINSSIGSTRTVTFPSGTFTPDPADIPVPGDYEGTGIDELAVYRPSTNQFIINENAGVVVVKLATNGAGDIPVPGNYDDSISQNPVHRTLPAVYNPTSGQWLIAGIAGNRTVQFNPGDVPAPGDYSGAGVTQTVVYRAGPGVPAFYGPNNTTIVQAIGKAGDIPVTAPLIYRNIVSNAPTLALNPASDTGIVGDNVTSARQPLFNGKTDPNTLVDLIDAQGNVLNTVSSDSTGAFKIAPASALKNGSYAFQARAHGIVSSTGPTSAAVGVTLVTVDGDYTGVGKTSVAVFRRTGPFLMQWFVQGYAPLLPTNFGAGILDVPLSGDFNGDGKIDPAVYRPSTAQWFYQDSTANYAGKLLTTFGYAGVDLPVPANYNGTGVTTVAVFRPTTGEWFVQGSGSSTIIVSPKAGDIPVPGNYDNTGSDEFAIFRPTTGQWIVNGIAGSYTLSLGQAGDVPVPGAYDATATSRATEVAVFRPSTGQYIIHGPTGNRTLQFNPGDIPAPGDYDGTGVTEAAVYRPSTAKWYVMGANDASPRQIASFGWPNHDVPPNTPYQYRALKTGGVTSNKLSDVAVAPPAGSTSTNPPVLGNGSSGTTSGLTPPAAAPPTTITSHPRHRPSQSHVAKTQSHNQSLIKHPLLAANRLPSAALANAKKSPGVKN